jgi:hypothetical protein
MTVLGSQLPHACLYTHTDICTEEELLLWDLVQGVGYFPSMTWFNAVSGSIESLLAATTGVKASLSSSTPVWHAL